MKPFTFTDEHHARLRHLASRDEDDLMEEEFDELENLRVAWYRTCEDAQPTPQCCADSRAHLAIVFVVDVYDEHDSRPAWRLRLASPRSFENGRPPVPTFCPFCGTRLPTMTKKAVPPAPLMVCTDGGNHCDTCEERLSSCTCWPPETAYEANPNPTIRTGPTGR